MIGSFLDYSTFFSGFYGGGIGQFLNSLQQTGFFSYVLPFLLLFAMIFGILTKMQLFKDNKAIMAIISLAVSLMALQFGFVSNFFANIFPRLGVAISIILVILIVLGLFMDPKKPWLMYILLGVAAIIVVVVIVQSSGDTGMAVSAWLSYNWGSALGMLVIVGGVIAAIVAITGPHQRSKQPATYEPILFYPPDKR